MTFWERIQYIIKIRGLESQSKFASLAGIDSTNLSHWSEAHERIIDGKGPDIAPSGNTIKKICDSFDICSDWLLFEIGYPTREESAQNFRTIDFFQLVDGAWKITQLPIPHKLTILRDDLNFSDVKFIQKADDSENPMILERDIFIVDSSKKQIRYGTPIAYYDKNEDYYDVKRVVVLSEKKVYLISFLSMAVLMPVPGDKELIELDLNRFEIIGEAVGVVKRWEFNHIIDPKSLSGVDH